MINIVLIEPRIPQNTGNIGRLCLATNAVLHLIHPLGFVLHSKYLKRAGMDYFEQIKLVEWDNLAHFHQYHSVDSRHFFFSTKGSQSYFEANFTQECYLYFGREDAGLPNLLIEQYSKQTFKIPMQNNARSLNLSNCVSIVVYEVIRQNL